jgi:hypothetical protein
MTKLDGQRSALSLNMARIIKDLKESELKLRGEEIPPRYARSGHVAGARSAPATN